MRPLFALLLLLTTLAACRPKPPAQPPADSTATDTVRVAPDTLDAPDSILTPPASDTLIPRASGFMGSIRLSSLAPPKGFTLGLGGYKPDLWCKGTLKAAILGANPASIAGYMRKAEYCGMRVAWSVRDIDLHERDGAPFDLAMARQAIDQLARALPPDTLTKYRAYIAYINVMDDLGSISRWGTRLPLLSELAALASYAQAKLGTVPICIRGRAEQLAAYANWSGLDCHIVQWTDTRGDQRQYYDRNKAVAVRLGIPRGVYTVNVRDGCHGQCSAAQVLVTQKLAIAYPDNCASIGFRYDETTFGPAKRATWQQLIAIAANTPYVDCAP